MSNNPADPTRKPTLQEVIGMALEAFERRIPKALPARVVKWNATNQRANCKVLVMKPYFDEEATRQVESIPVIPGVPVQFPGAGGFRMSFPISDGNLVIDGQTVAATTGLLIWCERSLDKWLSGVGHEVDPEFDHSHALTDAVFIPGLMPFGAPWTMPTDHATVGADGGVQIHFHKQTIVAGDEASADFVAAAQKTNDGLQAFFNILDGVFGNASTPLLTPAPSSPDPVYAAVKAAIAAYLLANPTKWPPASVATTEFKAK